jgi:arylamine N-acetyltransferase
MATLDRYGRATYSPAQIQAFFDRISLPQRHRSHAVVQNRALAHSPEGLHFLAILQKYTLAAIPFESLALHYSSHHTVSIDPQELFHKIVERGNGRGGYCMENSCLFGTVLRSLGYDVYPTGARVNEAVQPVAALKNWQGPKFDGWYVLAFRNLQCPSRVHGSQRPSNHMINIITIAGTKYFADVGFGSSGPHHPIPLTENYTSRNVGTQSLRLTREAPPDLLTTARLASTGSTDQRLWFYQYRHTDDSPWIPAYIFGETEFLPSDFLIMNHYTSTSRTSFFTYVVLCMKMVMAEGGEELVGDVTLMGNEVKKRIGGTSSTLAVCEREAQRVEALREFLGVKLSLEEMNGIVGMVSELK